MATTETRPVADIADIQEKDDAKSTLTAASKHEGGLSVDPEEERDMGLQLTCSFRSGVGPRELALEHPPDGGLRAWLQVAGTHMTIFSTWGFINSFGIFQAYYVEALQLPPSTISWIGSIQIFLLFLLGSVTGRALDGGFFFSVYRTGSFFVILGIFLTSLGTKYWHIFLSQGLLCGIGSGMIFCPSIALCSTYFQKRRSLAIGIGASGSATGGIIIPLIVQLLLPRVGFPWTMRVLGFVCLFLLTISNIVMKPRLKPRKVGSLIELAAFKEATYTLFALGMFLNFMGLYFAFFYVSAYAKQKIGLSQSDAFTTLIVMNAVGLPGRVVPNYLADRVTGPLNLLIPCAIMVGVLFLCWIAVFSHATLIIWAAFYGIFAAGIQSLFPATLSSLTTDLTKSGTRLGMVFSIVSFACLTGTPIGGAIIQSQMGEYWGGQIFAGCCVLTGGSVLAVSRIKKTGMVWKARA
ncbi:putative MFS monocarboxylate transporter [Pyronema domesticum]|uniref:Similar to Probable transporter MCH4 acc. no. Q08268 n=1 Tax=Pyronema omphalodes (strain CBS 100304) TaxID=1076935 RepID=U4LBQ5_PYROM|nr:putative MFS monocarboxylate transporter [Pyronema domesticum]CCX11695.1 Similar to Probable transporter MCH4; acc. no. Q08268 [Pyronema omphalodes CBS 100304]